MINRMGQTQRMLLAGGLVGALSLAVFAQSAGQGNGPGVAVTVRGSVSDTVGMLTKMVADNGMMVMGELHQGKVLAMTGLKVESETIFVGSPNVGKKLFSAEPGVGVAIPIRVNIYKDANGKTVVRYVPPTHQLGNFDNPTVTEVCKMLDGKLQNMVSMLPK